LLTPTPKTESQLQRRPSALQKYLPPDLNEYEFNLYTGSYIFLQGSILDRFLLNYLFIVSLNMMKESRACLRINAFVDLCGFDLFLLS